MSIGFKEWALICDALGRGEQSIIIRKGGIAEGRDGFRFKHDSFFLFPTLFHEQLAKTTLPPETPLPTLPEGQIEINLFCQVEWTELVTDWETVKRLAPFHIWKEQVIEERFRYDEPAGVHVALLRVFRLNQPWTFPNAPAYGGCRSWLNMPELPAELSWSPVLDDAAHAQRTAEIRSALGAID
jgi:hypothetical protein